MSAHENKARIRRFVEEYQTRDDARVFDETMHLDFVDRSRPPGISEGPEGVREIFDGLRATFSGFRAEIHHQVAEGDLVMTRKTFHGRHDGEFMGVAPTGRDVEIAVIDVVRMRDGRIVEHWNVVDIFGLLAQVGAAQAAPAFSD